MTNGCRDRARPGDGDSSAEAAGEPEQYSATVVRIVEDGTRRETSISREARSGEQRRGEWTEQVITERRDVRIEVAPDMFTVPADFKKVEKLPR